MWKPGGHSTIGVAIGEGLPLRVGIGEKLASTLAALVVLGLELKLAKLEIRISSTNAEGLPETLAL